jgi:hypothetical protein
VARCGATRVSQLSLLAGAAGLALAAVGTLGAITLASMLIGVGYGLVNPASSQRLFARTTAVERQLAGLATPPLALAFGWQAALLALAPRCCPRRWRWSRPDAAGTAVAPRPPVWPADLGCRGAHEVCCNPGLRALCQASFRFAGPPRLEPAQLRHQIGLGGDDGSRRRSLGACECILGALAGAISPTTGRHYGVARVCRVWGAVFVKVVAA